MRNTLLLVTIFTALILTTGCGSGKLATVVVTGTVTLNGVPLDDATVNFSPKVEGQGHPAFAVTDANGNYRLQTILGNPGAGTTPGEYLVSFIATDKRQGGAQGPSAESVDNSRPVFIPRSRIPDRYENSATSGHSAVVEARGNNVFNFDLKSP